MWYDLVTNKAFMEGVKMFEQESGKSFQLGMKVEVTQDESDITQSPGHFMYKTGQRGEITEVGDIHVSVRLDDGTTIFVYVENHLKQI